MQENERIRELRKSLNLTLEAFGRRIGVGKSAISDIERGRNAVNERMRRQICKEYDVSEKWLLTGEGPMRAKRTKREELEVFFRDVQTNDENFKLRLISVLAELKEDQWQLLEDMAEKLAAKKDPAMTPEEEIELKVEQYRKQLLEEKRAALSASSRSLREEAGGYETA